MKTVRVFIFIRLILFSFCTMVTANALADGTVVDKVYHPYVLPNEREFEWRFLSQQSDTNLLTQRIAYGQSFTDTLMVEFYLIGARDDAGDFGFEAYEIEARWMLTEQGQYWADWGLLAELEKEHNANNWELTTGVLFEKEFGRTSLTMNFFAIYEWGESIVNELETELRIQYRYRWLPEIQPALELYTGEDYAGIGPAFMGIHRFSGQKQLKWEAAFISELSNQQKDHSLRIAIEYEF